MKFITGYGAADSHALTLSTGQPNMSPNAGLPYNTVSLQEIVDRLAAPQRCDKAHGQWVIPSEYNAADARSHTAQRLHGTFHALVADIDSGNPSLADVQAVVSLTLPDVWFAIWSTPSSTEVKRKWRVFVPLAQPLTGPEYSCYQAAWFDGMTYHGLTLDRSLERTGQVFYLPNAGELYQWVAEGPVLLDAKAHVGLSIRAGQYLEMDAKERSNATVAANEGSRSYLRAFRAKHSIEDMLSIYGFECSPSNPDLWRYQGQSNQGYGGVRIMRYGDSDRWVSLSDTVNALGVGKPTPGGRSGDAFDLYCHFQCGGNQEQAIAYAKQCLAEEDLAWYGKECLHWAKMMEVGEWPDEYGELQPVAIWCGSDPLNCTARAQFALHQLSPASLPTQEAPQAETVQLAPTVAHAPQAAPAVALPAVTGAPGAASRPQYVNLPMPPGFVGKLARWIYGNYMYDPQWDIAIIAAYICCAAVVGRKPTYSGVNPGIDITCLGINGVGKDTVNRVLSAIIEALVIRYYTKALDPAESTNAAVWSNYMIQARTFGPITPTFGASQMVGDLITRVSGVIIYSEAGVADTSKAGDAATVKSGLMQYMAQPAHSRANIKASKDYHGDQPYGMCLSLFRESTKELEKQHMSKANITSGKVARGLTVTIDVSKQPDPSKSDIATTIDKDILDGFERMIAAASDGEDWTLNVPEGKNRPVGVSSTPSKPHSLAYIASPEVEAQFARLAAERTAMRRANTENVATMEWAHNIRDPMARKKYMLLLAHVDAVIEQKPPVLTMEHFNAVEAHIKECRRCELANATDYAHSWDQLAEVMRERIMATVKLKSTDEGMGGYVNCIPAVAGDINAGNTVLDKQARAQNALDNGIFPLTFFTNNRCKRSHAALEELRAVPQSKYGNMTPKQIYLDVLEAGDGNYWHLHLKPFIHVVVPR